MIKGLWQNYFFATAPFCIMLPEFGCACSIIPQSYPQDIRLLCMRFLPP